uniref:Pyrimidine 5'-nucleotidase n=1 Tax=Craspedostauros australis TaxID=1486917 RepID=A0A7R9WXU8_9STRA|mmetsp:Transcript_3902/g.10310  ORF Transcript_3902/g.10310 Transcript_3902/m.10310 type:complete len:249 (+) Transcript_3902:96-842(+)
MTSQFKEAASATEPIELLIFDLDGTLYDRDNGYTQHVHDNIFRFMAKTEGGKFDAIDSVATARKVWEPIFAKYNLTKRGLMAEGYDFDPIHYDTFIRRGASNFFAKDPVLREVLQSMPQRKVIFTNAPESSANEILQLLGVADLFDCVYGTDFLQNKVCKPEIAAFEKVLAEHASVPVSRICYFEDSFKNLVAGQKLGFRSVFIRSAATTDGDNFASADLEKFDAVLVGSVSEDRQRLREQLPGLWAK